MIAFDILNAIGRILLTTIVVYKVTQFREMTNATERFGLGMMGAGSFLTVPVLLYKNQNPYEGWSISILTIGAILFLAGRTWRDRKHSRANDLAREEGRLWQAQKGKP